MILQDPIIPYSGVTLNPEAKHDRIQRGTFELSRKYGKKVHEALVDQNLLSEYRTAMEKS